MHKDPDEARAYWREWQKQNRIKNLDKVRAAGRAKYRRNREKILAANADYRKGKEDEAKARVQAWAAANPEKVRNHRLKKYGITHEDYEVLLASQGGGCAICGSINSKNPRTQYFSVDHCHETGKVRGLLCMQCNSAIGYLDDNPELVEKALKYLQLNNCPQP